VDQAQATVSLGVRQLCCLINADSPSFDRAAGNLHRTTGIRLSGELLRQIIEQEGRKMLACGAQGQLPCPFNAAKDCTVNGVSRMYLGCDGFLASMITDSPKEAAPAENPWKTPVFYSVKGSGRWLGCLTAKPEPTSVTRSSNWCSSMTSITSAAWCL
jgi:hypothetical protein